MAATLAKVQAKKDLKLMLRTALAGYSGKGRKPTEGALFLTLQHITNTLAGIDKHGDPMEYTKEEVDKAEDKVIKLLPYVLEKAGDVGNKGNTLAGILSQGGTVTISFDKFKEDRALPDKQNIEVLASHNG